MVQANDRELRFSMVDGDFKKFEGKWSLKFGKRYISFTWLDNDYMNVEDTILYHPSFCSQIFVYSDVISFFTMLNSHMLGMHFPSEFLLDTIY